MKLDADDYENIYLRIRVRLTGLLWKAGAAICAILGIAGLGTAYVTLNQAIEKAVDLYVKTEAFQESIRGEAIRRSSVLEDRTNALETRILAQEKLVANLARLPLSVSETGLIVMDASGRKFFLEHGEGKAGEKVDFKSAFKNVPFIFISLKENPSQSHPINAKAAARELTLLAPNKLTSQGFALPKQSGFYPSTFVWVAMGQ